MRLAGIIHPSPFETTELIGSISQAFPPSPFQFFRHKNLELGAWDGLLATNDRKSIWAMCDGTIHNSLSLKEKLKKEGYFFTTEGDEEVIVHAYDAWGEEFISRLNGHFAIALFDEEKEMLYLIRDRLGQKNLYWTTQGEYWLFSTEIKGLLATGILPQTPSIVGLASYLYFGFIPQDLSAIKGVNKLLPGHFLKVDLNRQVAIGQFWSLSELLKEKKSLQPDKAYQELNRLLEESIRIALPREGTIGAIVSENVGSKTLHWHLSELVDQERVLSFSAGKINPEEVLRDLVKIVWQLDEPIANPYMLQTWRLSKSIGETSKCVVTDLGWEELFAGHGRYFLPTVLPTPHMAHRLARLPEYFLRGILSPICNLLHLNCKWRILRNIDINREQVAYQMSIALFKGKNRKRASPLLFSHFDPEVFTQRFHRLTFLPGSVDPFLYFDAKTELPDCLLFQYERLFDVNVITPFLDHRLVEFLAKMPEELKCEGKIPGVMLRNHLEKLGARVKMQKAEEPHFDDPAFREVFRLLATGLLVEEGIISPKWIRLQLRHPSFTPEMFRQLWALLIMEIWFRLYINKPIGKVDVNVDVRDFLK